MEEVPAPTPVVPTPSPTAPPVQPAVVVPAPVPTPPPPAQPVDVKSDKKPIFIIVGIVILLVVVSLLVGLFIKSRKTGVRTVDLSKGGKNPALTAFEDLSKYDKDTDGDGYPDFVEVAVGLNPNESEFIRCGGGKGCKDPTL